MNNEGKWEKRWHPLREEWVVYSAHRNNRPWQGAGKATPKPAPDFDATCYLCPGNKRIHGSSNPDYKDVFIFENNSSESFNASALHAADGGIWRSRLTALFI